MYRVNIKVLLSRIAGKLKKMVTKLTQDDLAFEDQSDIVNPQGEQKEGTGKDEEALT